MKKVNINIWDDFYDDGHIPEGKTQSTYIYIEENEAYVPHSEQKEIIENLILFLKSTKSFSNVEMTIRMYDTKERYPQMKDDQSGFKHWSRWEIFILNITHEILDALIEEIESKDLKMGNYKLNIYSES